MIKNDYIEGILLTCLSAILFGLNPYFVILLRSQNMGILFPLILRFFGGLLIYFLMIVQNKKVKALKINKDCYPLLFLDGIFFLATAGLLIYSYSLIPSGLATVLHFSYPVIITLLSVKAKRDKFSLPLLFGLILSITGIFFVSSPDCKSISMFGIFIALSSAFTFAFYLFILNTKKLKSLDNNIFVFYLSLFSLILLILPSFISFYKGDFINNLGSINKEVVIGAIGFVLSCAYGVSLFSLGARKIGGPIAGTISAFEPLTAVAMGIIVLNEPSPSLFIFGVVFIILSTLILSLSSFGLKKKKNQ